MDKEYKKYRTVQKCKIVDREIQGGISAAVASAVRRNEFMPSFFLILYDMFNSNGCLL
jgi:hypothetical protein